LQRSTRPNRQEVRVTRIEVDFNNRDDQGLVPANAAEASGPIERNSIVEAFDDEGYRCFAMVGSVRHDVVTLSPLWETFAAPDAARLVPSSSSNSAVELIPTNRLTATFGFPWSTRRVARDLGQQSNSGMAAVHG
jgi:hypothetical protein